MLFNFDLTCYALSCQHIYLGTLGRTNAANVTLAEAIRISHTLGLHDERAAPAQANVVEREMRRRTFWLLCEYLGTKYERSSLIVPLRRLRPDHHGTHRRSALDQRRRPLPAITTVHRRQPPHALWCIHSTSWNHTDPSWVPLQLPPSSYSRRGVDFPQIRCRSMSRFLRRPVPNLELPPAAVGRGVHSARLPLL